MTGQLFDTPNIPGHPATFPEAIYGFFDQIVPANANVLDPFAGKGGIHKLNGLNGRTTTGIELEAEWAECHPRTIVGTALDLPFSDNEFDAVVTSPAYGNRLADSYAGDGTLRFSYRISLGRPLTDGSGAGLHWGDDYRTMHETALKEMIRVTKPEGLIVINMKDHQRQGEHQAVCDWWAYTMTDHGLTITDRILMHSGGIGFAKHPNKAPEEIIVTTKPESLTT